jgi:diketogulonate reductase-like aldo/keto reductase
MTKKFKMNDTPKIHKLNNGLTIPIIGLGTSKIARPEEIVYNSIKHGVRLIDTAYKYENEEEVGKGIKRALTEGLCKREDLIIIGKVWISNRKDPERALRNTLQYLGINYIDIYLDHWPYGKDYRKGEVNDPFMPNISISL